MWVYNLAILISGQDIHSLSHGISSPRVTIWGIISKAYDLGACSLALSILRPGKSFIRQRGLQSGAYCLRVGNVALPILKDGHLLIHPLVLRSGVQNLGAHFLAQPSLGPDIHCFAHGAHSVGLTVQGLAVSRNPY